MGEIPREPFLGGSLRRLLRQVPGGPLSPASTGQPLSALLKRSSTVLQTSPGGSHGATNPKTWLRDDPPPSGLPIGPSPLSFFPCLAFPSRVEVAGGVGCTRCWLWSRSRLCSRRRAGGKRATGTGRRRGARGPGVAQAPRPAHAGRGPAAGPGGPSRRGRPPRTCRPGCPLPCLAQSGVNPEACSALLSPSSLAMP